jgi:hypothetical protein
MVQEISAGLDRHPRDDGGSVAKGGVEVNERSGMKVLRAEVHENLILIASEGDLGLV